MYGVAVSAVSHGFMIRAMLPHLSLLINTGVILYALVCARLPFDDKHIPTLFKKIRQGQYVIPSHVSEGISILTHGRIGAQQSLIRS